MSSKRIVIVTKWSLDQLYPLVTAGLLLAEKGHRVTLLAVGCPERLRQDLESKGIEIVSVMPGSKVPRTLPGKVWYWARFRSLATRALRDIRPLDLLWVGSADTALALGKAVFRHRYVLQLHELYDTSPMYLRGLRPFVSRAACVVVPEYCRATILRVWFRLAYTPTVLPNCPLEHPRLRNLPISSPAAAAALQQVGEKDRLVLYQGLIQRDRDIRAIARCVSELANGWRLLLMGPDSDGFLASIRDECPELIHIPFVPPPQHLEITSRAHLGVAVYDYSSLNNVFCAPNKIWEYGGFGIPMLCGDVPGLRYTVAAMAAGECCKLESIDDVRAAIKGIDQDYERYSKAATELFEGCDLAKPIDDILRNALS